MKKQFAEENLKIGAVLKYHVTFTIPPKTKRIIIVGIDNQRVALASVLINTEINPNRFPTTELKNLHLELKSEDRIYLDHTSFVDCSQIFEQDIADLKKMLIEDSSVHLGELSEEDIDTVVNKIKNAKTIPIKTKKKFGLFY